jgi:hypothetical protein
MDLPAVVSLSFPVVIFMKRFIYRKFLKPVFFSALDIITVLWVREAEALVGIYTVFIAQAYQTSKEFLSTWTHAHTGSSLADFSTLKIEAIRSSETSVPTTFTRRHNPEDGILHFTTCNLREYWRNAVHALVMPSLQLPRYVLFVGLSYSFCALS